MFYDTRTKRFKLCEQWHLNWSDLLKLQVGCRLIRAYFDNTDNTTLFKSFADRSWIQQGFSVTSLNYRHVNFQIHIHPDSAIWTRRNKEMGRNYRKWLQTGNFVWKIKKMTTNWSLSKSITVWIQNKILSKLEVLTTKLGNRLDIVEDQILGMQKDTCLLNPCVNGRCYYNGDTFKYEKLQIHSIPVNNVDSTSVT